MSKPYLCYTHIWKVLLEIAVTLEENLSTYPGLNCTLVFMKTKIFLFLNFFFSHETDVLAKSKGRYWKWIKRKGNLRSTCFSNMTTAAAICYKRFFFWKHNCVIFFWSKIAMALDKHISDLKKSRDFQICI